MSKHVGPLCRVEITGLSIQRIGSLVDGQPEKARHPFDGRFVPMERCVLMGRATGATPAVSSG